MKTSPEEIEDGIAGCFMRKYKMYPERVPGTRPNFHFYELSDSLRRGKYRGSAAVLRVYGNMGDLDLKELGGLFWGDEKGITIIGFDDVAAWKTRDRDKFIQFFERKGCYV